MRDAVWKSRNAVNSIFALIQIWVIVGLVAKEQPAFARSVAATTFVYVVYSWLEVHFALFMNNYVRTVTMLAIISDGFFGYYLGYYVTSSVFDKVQHVFGIYAFSLFFYILMAQAKIAFMSRLATSLLIVSLGVSIGTIYEIAEFLVDTFGHPAIPAQSGLADTDMDLIADSVGAVFAAIHVRFSSFLDKASS